MRKGFRMKQFQLVEDGFPYKIVRAKDLAEALEIAKSNFDRSNYVPENELASFRVEVEVYQLDSSGDRVGESISEKFVCHPDEPECSEASHKWESPYELVGGIKDNPGVWGKGGGVIVKEVCSHCSLMRVTDTWTTDYSTGEIYTSISYSRESYGESYGESYED